MWQTFLNWVKDRPGDLDKLHDELNSALHKLLFYLVKVGNEQACQAWSEMKSDEAKAFWRRIGVQVRRLSQRYVRCIN
jgi:hypothetical protein